ncbi:MAG: O-methyltransferase [bacterium]
MSELNSLIPEQDNYLKKMEEVAAREEIPIIQTEVAQFLKVLIKIKKPKRILEIGTAIGYSTSWLARAAGKDVEIVTIEIDEAMAERAASNFKKLGIAEQVNLKIGDALEIIPYLRREFDFVFIDAAKGQYLNYLEMSLELLAKGGLIVADNVLYKGYVNRSTDIKRKRRTMVRRLEKYLDLVTNHPLLDSSVIELGDGLAISVKK